MRDLVQSLYTRSGPEPWLMVAVRSLAFTVALLASAAAPALGQGTEAHVDLVVNDVRLSPEFPVDGDYVNFIATIENMGNAAASGSFIVRFFVDGIIATADSTLADLQPHQPADVWSSSFQVGAGGHSIKATADAGGAIAETNESNNGREERFEVALRESGNATTSPAPSPGYVSLGVEVQPQPAFAGDVLTFTVYNKGTAAAKGTASYDIYRCPCFDGSPGELVYSPPVIQVEQTLEPNGYFAYRWDQRNGDGVQVEPGEFRFVFRMGESEGIGYFWIERAHAEGFVGIEFATQRGGGYASVAPGEIVVIRVSWDVRNAREGSRLEVGVTRNDGSVPPPCAPPPATSTGGGGTSETSESPDYSCAPSDDVLLDGPRYLYRFDIDESTATSPYGRVALKWDQRDGAGNLVGPGCYGISASYGGVNGGAQLCVSEEARPAPYPEEPVVRPVPGGFTCDGGACKGQYVSFMLESGAGEIVAYRVGDRTVFDRIRARSGDCFGGVSVENMEGQLFVKTPCAGFAIMDVPGGAIATGPLGAAGTRVTYSFAPAAGVSVEVGADGVKLSGSGVEGRLGVADPGCGSFGRSSEGITIDVASEGQTGDVKNEQAPRCLVLFNGFAFDFRPGEVPQPLTPEEAKVYGEVAAAVSEAIVERKVGAQAVVRADASGKPALESVKSHNGVRMEMVAASEAELKLTVDSDSPEGRSVVIDVGHSAIRINDKARVLFDGQPIELCDSLDDCLDSTDDGDKPAEYMIVCAKNGCQVFVSVSHYSIHTIQILTSDGVQAFLVQGMLVGGGMVAMAAIFMFRKPEE